MYTFSQLVQYAQNAGFTGNNSIIAAAIAMAESGGNPNAYNAELSSNTPLGNGSRGLWQIYGNAHPEYNNNSMYNPIDNAKAAFAIYQAAGNSFTPWSTYKSGAYMQYLMNTSTNTNGNSGYNPMPGSSPAQTISGWLGNLGSTLSGNNPISNAGSFLTNLPSTLSAWFAKGEMLIVIVIIGLIGLYLLLEQPATVVLQNGQKLAAAAAEGGA